MKIGILEVGLLNDKVINRFDPYPVMFTTLLDRAGRTLEYQVYSVIRGDMPVSVDDCNGWLITGSRHGVYENLDWMLQLESFIRDLYKASKPLIGVCFGHQIIAQALGGKVIQSDKGWGIGLHAYHVDKPQKWMSTAAQAVRIYAFHQDQVVELPTAAKVFLSSSFCPYAGLTYGDSIISIQAHPEFESAYEYALIDMYRGNIVPEAAANAALEGMQGAPSRADTQMLAEWMVTFLAG